jgi:Ala-tRNA(Pro) deacylase
MVLWVYPWWTCLSKADPNEPLLFIDFIKYNYPMISSEIEFLQYLDTHGISYQRLTHPAVYTCEQAERFRPKTQGVSTKNLFLADKKQDNFYLVMLACEKRLDIRQLRQQLDGAKLHFGNEARLLEFLGVTPGAVTVLGLVNDTGQRVTLFVDRQIWDQQYFLCHPLVNTATLVLAKPDLIRFFELTGHAIHVIDIAPA